MARDQRRLGVLRGVSPSWKCDLLEWSVTEKDQVVTGGGRRTVGLTKPTSNPAEGKRAEVELATGVMVREWWVQKADGKDLRSRCRKWRQAAWNTRGKGSK